MNPNEHLERQREILDELRELAEDIEKAQERGEGEFGDYREGQHVLLDELAALAEGMDEWLSKGGFLPDEWQHQPDVAARKLDNQTTAVTIAGVDVYVRDDGDATVVSVGTEELPAHKRACVESLDGVSWARELP